MLTGSRDDLRAPLPAWAAAPDVGAPSAVGRGVATRAATAAVVVVGLVWLGHHGAAQLLAAVFGVVTALSLLVPAVPRAIDRLTARFQVLVGRLLTVVLLTVIFAVVFVPAWILLRLLRRDPLALGSSPADASFWRVAARRSGRSLHRRPFTDGRHPASLAPSRARSRGAVRLAAALGVLVVLAGVDLGIGALLDATSTDEDGAAGGTASGSPEAQAASSEPRFSLPVPDVGAREDEPWAQELFDELALAYDRSEYHPFRGWTVPDMDGTHVHVEDEVRRSYAQRDVAGEPLEVLFFGGSTTMGWFQRDDHTIPSAFARRAEADGIAVRAVNYGQPAYQNWQEVLLLQEVVSRGEVPDLVVFYDGANELGAQFRSGPSDDPIHLQSTAIEERLAATRLPAGEPVDDRSPFARMYDAYADVSAVHRLLREVPVDAIPLTAPPSTRRSQPGEPMEPWPDQQVRPDVRGAAAARLHRRGVELATSVGEGFGFPTAFFWQPFIYSKEPVAGEEEVVGSWGTDPASWRTAFEAAQAGLHPSVVDLSDALDEAGEPLYYDFVHTNERGAALVAEAMYRHLRPALLELSGSRS